MHTITNLDGGVPGPPVELRRNRWKYTAEQPTGTNGWNGYRSAVTNPGGFVRATVNAAAAAEASGAAAQTTAVVMPPAPPESTFVLSAEVRGTAGMGAVVLQFYDATLTYIVGSQRTGAYVLLDPVAWVEAPAVTATAPPTSAYVRALVVRGTASVVGDVLDIRRVTVESGAVRLGEPFNGSTPSEPDDDISYAWLGQMYASESVARRATWSILDKSRPLAVAGYSTDLASRNEFHDLLDGSIGVSFVPPRPRSGTLVTVYTSRTDAFAAVAMYRAGRVFRYASTDLPEIGMDFALDGVLSVEQDADDTDVWYVLVGYQEV